MNVKCLLGFHDWAKCIHPANGVYLYGQKYCTRCNVRDIGFAEKEEPKKKAVIATKLVYSKVQPNDYGY